MASLTPRPVALRSRSPRPPISSKTSTTKVPSSSLKEPVHLPLHRRLLFPQYPPEKALPRIVQGDGADLVILNERLYHLLALILRGYVLSWYPRFTKDRTLLPVLARTVLVPLIEGVLQRIYDDPSQVAVLVLVELPTMLELHLKIYWAARAAVALDLPLPNDSGPSRSEKEVQDGEGEALARRLGEAYHARLPLPGVIPAPSVETSTQDHKDEEGENPTSPAPYRTPVAAGQYIASPEYLSALSDAILARNLPPDEYKVGVERSMAIEILGRAILVNVCRRLAESWTWYQLLLKFLPSPRHPSTQPSAIGEGERRSIPHLVMIWLFGIYDLLILLWTRGVALVALYTASPPLDPRYRGSTDAWLAVGRELIGVDGHEGLSRRRWGLRMAWGVCEVAVFLCGGLLDRLLPHLLHSTILTSRFAIRLTEITEAVLFPNGYPSGSPPDPSPAEVAALRQAVEEKISALIPPPLRALLCPEPGDISALVDPLSSAGCNAHLVAMLLDGIVRALDPEIAAPSTQ